MTCKLVYGENCCHIIVDGESYYAYDFDKETDTFDGEVVDIPEIVVEPKKKKKHIKRKRFDIPYNYM